MGREHGDGDTGRPLPPWMRPKVKPPDQLGVFQPPSPSSPSQDPDGGTASPDPPAARPPGGRRIDLPAFGTLLIAVPWLLYGFLVIGLFSAALGLALFIIPLWILSGALMFFPPAETAIARYLYRFRPPTSRELDILQPAWEEVAGRAGIDPGRFRLWVQDADDLNASASAGHILAVTRQAVDTMPPHQLRAVLAHELGHHSAGHAWSTLLLYWYSMPGRFFNGVLATAAWVALWVGAQALRALLYVFGAMLKIVSHLPLLFMIAGLIGICLLAATVLEFIGAVVDSIVAAAVLLTRIGVLPAVLAVVFLTPPLMAWVSRRAELRADRIAARVGYGHALVDVMEDWLAMGMRDGRREAFRDRILATHPPIDIRIRRLKATLGMP